MRINSDLQLSVEQNSEQLNAILDDLVKEYTDAMDEYIDKIRVFLEAGVEQLTLEELNNIMLRISTYNYFLAGRLEKAGIKSSVAQAVRDEAYNKAYRNHITGTVEHKKAIANESIVDEEVINIIYGRLYKLLKSKYDSAVRLIEGLRKIITAKVEEMKLAQIKGL